jgi:hypothetical protein
MVRVFEDGRDAARSTHAAEMTEPIA